MPEIKVIDLLETCAQVVRPSNMPDVSETLLLRINDEEAIRITVQEGIYAFQEGEGSDDIENIVECNPWFLGNAINGSTDARTLWTAFAEPKNDFIVKYGNGASMIPLIQSMKRAYTDSFNVQEMVKEFLRGALEKK